MSAVPVPPDERVRIVGEEELSNDWYLLKKTTFDFRRRDGSWQRLSRETYDRGNGATILLYNREHKTVILTRQFRFPAYVNGSRDGMLIESCAGLLDTEDAATCIRRETEEETGYRIGAVHRVLEAYMSPGSVTERLTFFVARYERRQRASTGGGERSEGEDIEVLERTLDEALADGGAWRDLRRQDDHLAPARQAERPGRMRPAGRGECAPASAGAGQPGRGVGARSLSGPFAGRADVPALSRSASGTMSKVGVPDLRAVRA
jgi:GDP-mannose pyrophosphatase NudK